MANLDMPKARVAELLRDVYDREVALLPSNPLLEASKEFLNECARQYRKYSNPVTFPVMFPDTLSVTLPVALFDISPASLWKPRRQGQHATGARLAFGWIRIVFTLRYQVPPAILHSFPSCPVFVSVFLNKELSQSRGKFCRLACSAFDPDELSFSRIAHEIPNCPGPRPCDAPSGLWRIDSTTCRF